MPARAHRTSRSVTEWPSANDDGARHSPGRPRPRGARSPPRPRVPRGPARRARERRPQLRARRRAAAGRRRRSAARPRAAPRRPPGTAAMISATASATDSAAGTRARSARPRLTASPTRPTHPARSVARTRPSSSSISAALQLVRDRVGDQAGRGGHDLLAHDEAVLAQRRAGRRQVDDALDEARQGRELDRALDLDDLRLAPGALELAPGDPGVLRRDAHHAEAPQRLGRRILAGDGREHHRARP